MYCPYNPNYPTHQLCFTTHNNHTCFFFRKQTWMLPWTWMSSYRCFLPSSPHRDSQETNLTTRIIRSRVRRDSCFVSSRYCLRTVLTVIINKTIVCVLVCLCVCLCECDVCVCVCVSEWVRCVWVSEWVSERASERNVCVWMSERVSECVCVHVVCGWVCVLCVHMVCVCMWCVCMYVVCVHVVCVRVCMS